MSISLTLNTALLALYCVGAVAYFFYSLGEHHGAKREPLYVVDYAILSFSATLWPALVLLLLGME
jgi:hypothetical protein